MSKLITARNAAISLLFIFIAVSFYHIAALAGIIPIDMVWGGRLTSRTELIRFELVSLAINFGMMAVVWTKLKMMDQPTRVVTGLLWLMAILFALNTIGNLFAMNSLEAILFAPATFISALFCVRLALHKAASS